MERKFLESLGIEKEAIDKIMAENGKDIEAQKALTAAETQKVTAANNTIKQLQDAVKKFDGVDVEKLKGDLAALQQKYNADTAKLRLDNALDVAIIGAKGRSTKAVKAFLDYGKLKLKDDGTIDGLDLEALKKRAVSFRGRQNQHYRGRRSRRRKRAAGGGRTAQGLRRLQKMA